MADPTGLKLRGYSHSDVDERRAAAEKFSGTSLENISKYCFDSEKASKNVENMIGSIQIPLGYAGPVTVSGDYASGRFLVPLATTEGALIASISRGMSVTETSGGIRTKVFRDAMTRAPVFRVKDLAHAAEVIEWVNGNMNVIEEAISKTTSHGKLLEIDSYPNGRSLYLRFAYSTGDAMGMNMTTIATEAACRVIEQGTGAELVSVSGNMCSDKKPAAINIIKGRGKTVVAEALIPQTIVENKLHTTVESIIEVNYRKNLMGGAMSGTLGANAHAANMVAALYIATGQDPAHVVSASMSFVSCENVDGDLYIAVRMPAVEVGTVGGGTSLPCQTEALKMIDCLGEGKAKKFSEIVAATVLAGELSNLAAQAAGQLGSAHSSLGR